MKNLLENATKFAYESTAVRLVADMVTESDADSKALRLRVIDRGVGIPFGHQQRIFERFFQVDPSRNGQSNRTLARCRCPHEYQRFHSSIANRA